MSKEPELSKKAIKKIEEAKKRMNKGKYVSEKEARKILSNK